MLPVHKMPLTGLSWCTLFVLMQLAALLGWLYVEAWLWVIKTVYVLLTHPQGPINIINISKMV